MEQQPHNRVNVLWIGRMIFGRNIRVREAELARRLADRANLFALDHTEAVSKVRTRIGEKIRLRLELFRVPFGVIEEKPVARFRMPVAVGTGPWLSAPAAEWNERTLRRALNKFGCDRVFLSSPFFFMPPEQRDYQLHYDVIDNFHDQWPDTRTGRNRREFHIEQLRRADSVSASSLQLCDYVQRLAGRQAVYIPNGAPLAELRAVATSQSDAVRARLGLEDRFVLGYIGNHTQPYYGMERIVRALLKARQTRPDLALLIVGPGGERALEFCDGETDGVFVAGGVPPDEVSVYFQACDAGVHPYDPRPQTHDAMALNVIEFSACNKPVLSNPLSEFLRLGLPNVRFTDSPSIDDWAAALVDPASFAEFDRGALQHATAGFDWQASADKLAATMNLTDGPAPAAQPVSSRALNVVHFERKPIADYHSIERLFQSIRRALLPLTDVHAEVCPEVSRGLLPRLRNLRWAKRIAGRVNHITGDLHYLALRLPGERTVLTVHDCIALQRAGGLKRAVLRKLYFQWPVRRARIVTTISQTTKDELVRETACDPDKIRVVPNCVSDIFQNAPREFAATPTVLLVGTLPHKNLERMAEALQPLGCRLHILGRLTGQQQALLARLELEYVNEFDLAPGRMAAAYRDCDIVGFASLYEGFGMPILEGQATGRVVLTSNLSSMPEVAGDAACLVDPHDTAAIRAGFERIIGDADYRNGLVEAGLENARRYSPARIAKMYAQLYRELA